MKNPKKIFEALDANPNEMNLEGKINLVMELAEYMSEKQLDNIIGGMKHRYKCKEVKKNDLEKTNTRLGSRKET